ncbi:hypothetical protein C8A01DRAFT_21471, partial [Parachaetomium inaequale]
GQIRQVEQARFWQAESDEERLALLREARGGGGGGGGTGSVTPRYWGVLKRHLESGRLRLMERVRLVGARFEAEPEVETPVSPPLPPMDWIYFATGVESDFATLPCLQSMLERHLIEGCGGFPCLNDDLMWKDGVPLFVAGKLAALKLGPSAPNLGGARLAAERIGWGVEEAVRKGCGLLHGGVGRDDNREEAELVGYARGTGYMFGSMTEMSS